MKKSNSMNFENILVGLDLSNMDELLIQYTSFICAKLGVKKIYFYHNVKRYDLPENIEKMLGNVDLSTEIEQDVEELIGEYFKAETEYEILLSEEDYTEEIMNFTLKKYGIDCVMVGKKEALPGSGGLISKLVRMVECPIFVVPDSARHSLSNILVPVDFSKYSRKAFLFAHSIAETTGSSVESLHAYQLPSQYFPFISSEKATKEMAKHVREKYRNFVKKSGVETDTECSFIMTEDSDIAEYIKQHAVQNRSDLVVVGHRGTNALSTFLLGTVVEGLLNMSANFPFIIVK